MLGDLFNLPQVFCCTWWIAFIPIHGIVFCVIADTIQFAKERKIMKAYGKKLWWIENQHYGDELHTGIPLPSSGKRRGQRRKRYERIFKKMERQHCKSKIKKIINSIDNAEV